ncbi:hypothetical protein [Nannocystis pusilla]|uniref:hypothetical protein n=1 Tax=Nannocystis pusilla TaxID=889268 RepID=UPI003B82CB39
MELLEELGQGIGADSERGAGVEDQLHRRLGGFFGAVADAASDARGVDVQPAPRARAGGELIRCPFGQVERPAIAAEGARVQQAFEAELADRLRQPAAAGQAGVLAPLGCLAGVHDTSPRRWRRSARG